MEWFGYILYFFTRVKYNLEQYVKDIQPNILIRKNSMHELFLFLLTIVVVVMIVRIGAIAFELTGMPWEQAKFQALSCFTLTGFTTREALLVTRHPQRKKIAALMMVLGYAGSISLIATFVNFLRPIFEMGRTYHYIPMADIWVPSVLVQVGKLVVLVVCLLVLSRFFLRSKLWEFISMRIRERIRKANLISNVTFEDMAIGDKGFGIMRIAVNDNDEFVGKPILQSGFRKTVGAQILTIERKSKVIANPEANEMILPGDIIYCFGRRKDLKKAL